MSIDEVNRPSSSEIAKEDFNKNLRNKDSTQMAKSGQQSARQVKEKSAFEKVLDNVTQSTSEAQAEESKKFDARLKDVLSDENKHDDKKHSSKKDEKTDDKKSLKSESDHKETGRSKEGLIKDRVLGKQGSGGEKSGTGGGGSSGKDSSKQFGQGQFKQPLAAPATIVPTEKVAALDNVFAIKSAQTKQVGQIPKVVLDAIVQSIRIGLNKKLEKEMQIDLSDKVFKGLSLKISSHQGKVEVTFLTGDPDVRRLFEGQRNKIGDALKEKNIQVSNVKVQFLG